MIAGIEFKTLTTHTDRRGFFRELLRSSDEIFKEGFGQLSHSLMLNGVTKAWHYHRLQTDWWYVVTGVLRVGLYDRREASKTVGQTMDFLMGDFQEACVVKIPPGVVHGCQTVQGPVHLFYVTSRTYDPDDELRIPYDDPTIAFDWMKGTEIV